MMDSLMIIDIVLLVGAAQGLILCIPLLRYRNNRVPNRILVAFILLLAVDLVCACLNNSTLVLEYPFLYDLNASFPFLFTPIMYFYISVMTGKITRFRPRDLVHLIPFLAHAAFTYFVFYRLPSSGKLEIISAALASGRILDRKMFMKGPSGVPLPGFGVLCLLALSYVIAIAKRIRDYRREVRNFYSVIGRKVLGLLVLSLAIATAIWILVTVVIVSGAKIQLFPMILYTFGIYAGAYKMVTIPEVFSGNRAMHALLAPSEEIGKPNQEIAVQKFHDHLRQRKAYLDPEVTIGDISKGIGVPVHQLSKAINLSLGKNFYQCVNELRVEEAKRKLVDERFSDTSILDIGMEAGFNSKSTFNDVFKKLAGITPSQYRNKKKEPQK